MDQVYNGLVSEVVVLHKNRLSRFATDLLKYFFKKAGVKLVVHCAGEDCRGPMSSQRTSLPSQPCLSQAIIENEARGAKKAKQSVG